MKQVKGILRHLDYTEVRPREGDWTPLSELDDRYGTTGETDVIWDQDEKEVRLRDRETGEEVAIARRPSA